MLKLTNQFLVFSLFFLTALSQGNPSINGRVINGQTNEGIPYCSVVYLKKDKGVFSDSLGNFNLPYELLIDSIQITSLGFETKILNVQTLKEQNGTVSLTPKVYRLDELVINSKVDVVKRVKKELGHFAKRKSAAYGIGPGYIGRTIAIYIPNTNVNLQKKVSEIKYKIANHKKSIVRVQLYTKNSVSNLPEMPLITEDLVIKLNKGQDDLIVNIEKYNVQMPKTGLFISLQWLGEIDDKGHVTDNVKNINPTYKYNLYDSLGDNSSYVSFLSKKWAENVFFYNGKYNISCFGISVIEYQD